MYRTDLVFEGQKRSVSFFDDDTIDVVRQQIAKSIDIHHDRLFILVGIKLNRNYYTQDPRNWEMLFNRISLNGLPIQREAFQSYCSEYRIPALSIPYLKLDKEEWMTYPKFLHDLYDPGGEFVEYRIFGVDQSKAYCIPLSIDTSLSSMIPAAQYPIPENSTLFLSLYDMDDVRGFLLKEYQTGYEGAYFPLYRSSTPSRLSEGQIRLLDSNSKHLQDLLSLDPPAPTAIHILKSNWKTDLVDTNFGDAEHTRFEQIFYGITVSEDVPCITFFTGKNEISRHKFYKKDAYTKTPHLDLRIWSAWWAKSKPSRDKIPTLVLYRGSDRENFDRITILPTEIIFAVYRDITNTKSLSDLKSDLLSWFQKFDAVVPFIEPSDLMPCRIALQRELKIEAVYSTSLNEFEKRRMNCVSGLFDESRSNPTIFRILRSDDANNEINPRDLKVLNLLRSDPFIPYSQVEEELKVTPQESIQILNTIRARIEEQPNLLNREFPKLPILEVKPKSVVVRYINSIERFMKYVNILRYILSNPTSKDVDRVCPKRMETVEAAIVTTATLDYVDAEFSDLFGYLEGDVEESPKEKEKEKQTVPSKDKKTTYSYFIDRLKEFDPVKFGIGEKVNYPKKCEQSYQPIILSDQEIQDIVNDVTKGSEFDPREYSDTKKYELENPNGVAVCPEYWCLFDKIPLQESQLDVIKGVKVCPVCHGKIREAKDTKSDTREFSVVKRTKGFSYPKLKEYSNDKNKVVLPCCFKTERERKLVKTETEGKYYILSEKKLDLASLRFAYLPVSLINSLHIQETYAIAIKSGDRIQTGMSGFFRVGINKPSDDIVSILGLTTKIQSPRNLVSAILRCSFVASWPNVSDTHATELENKIADIEPFKSCLITRRHMARVISSIDVAFEKKELTKLQELEYTAIVLSIDIFRINLETQTLSCTFYTQQMKKRTRGIIVLQQSTVMDCLCFVTRQQKKFQYRANIFEAPFTYDTYAELEKKRIKSCLTAIPTFANAVEFVKSLGVTEEFSIVLDPFGRAQALYIPNELLLPFQNVPIPPFKQPKIEGYKDIRELPTYKDTRILLKSAQKITPGYEWSEDLHDGKGNIVEILTQSGLRIPVQPTKGEGEASEVMHTILREGETTLALGESNLSDLQTYKEISYATELYEFLIFQLTKDVAHDYSELKYALAAITPKYKELEPALRSWFDETTHFVSSDQPIEFLSKIRKPCGQFKSKNVCESGHMCAWNKTKCNIQVRNTLSKTKLFNKLLGTLLENSKIRSMILDGRTTPFFSTVLYINLPTEVILTDLEIKNEMI